MSTPALPLWAVMQVWLPVGWALVLAGWTCYVVGSITRRRWALAAIPLLVAVWTLWPSSRGIAHWLGMAFQAPSIVLVFLSVCVGWRAWRGIPLPRPSRTGWVLLATGLLWGWVLLLDSFALLPVAVYDLGFGVPALVGAAVAFLWPWLLRDGPRQAMPWVAVLTLLLFVVSRLPTGNVWDAVLDPWLWFGLHLYAIRWVVQRR